jgi:toxin ParE1/3/4
MPLELKFSRRARQDLNNIYTYLKPRNISGANAVLRAIEKSCHVLTGSPQSARATSMDGIRVKPLPDFPYLIFYTVERNRLFIVHVRHTARKELSNGDL